MPDTNTTEPAERSGWHFDRTISLPVVLTVLVLLGGLTAQSWTALSWANAMTAQVEDLKRESARIQVAFADGDRRILDRADERYRGITARLDVLERDKDRITRVEEQVRGAIELLREIRLEMGRPRR